jgi:hypothetical protein
MPARNQKTQQDASVPFQARSFQALCKTIRVRIARIRPAAAASITVNLDPRENRASAVGVHALLPLAAAYGPPLPAVDGDTTPIELRELEWLESVVPVEGDRIHPATIRYRRRPHL